MPQFDANFDLSALNGRNGFQISGEVFFDKSGFSVSNAGDVNGDGFDDLIVGAPRADPQGNESGASYIVFGKAGDFSANVNLSNLNGNNGFKISGEKANSFSGYSVSSAGDVNGDGFDDLIIASSSLYDGSSDSASYVLFGKAGGFSANVNLSNLNGNNGFKISGGDGNDDRSSVSSAGDINGDGFADVIIGFRSADPHGSSSGASYVVFGKADGFAANINLTGLNGKNGFVISGEATNDLSGSSVSSAGDVNGDGFDDLIVGARGVKSHGTFGGASYVVFGKADGFAANFDLSSLNGNNGFQISGEATYSYTGSAVSSAGDVNGDGFDDIIVGAPSTLVFADTSNASYVVFGQADGFAANMDLSDLDGINGFKISGEARDQYSGCSVSSAGDVNGDGFDDVIVGARDADPHGKDSGASYVVFGKAGGFAASVNLSNLNGNNGFKISGEAADENSGRSVSAAGDVNGDGFDDLIVGAPYGGANPNINGASYVIFGHRALTAVTITGTGIAQTSNGGYGDDTILGLAGNDTLIGWEGVDKLIGGNGNDKLLGGRDKDILTGGAGDDLFRYDEIKDGGDKITDFARGGLSGGDRVDVSRIDAIARGGDDDFAFGGKMATAHGVWYRVQGGNATVFADTDGDKSTAEMTVVLIGVTSLNQGDFIL